MLPELPSRRLEPNYYTGEPERFHLPVCYDLALLSCPDTIVAIGLGDAQAYFVFCQAVREHALGARCFAIHRNGDAAELAADEKWQRALKDGAECYGEAAQFIPRAPLEAARDFAAGSVNLLFFNDCDSAADIRALWQAWATKLSTDAIVVLHGTRLERTPGLEELWRELSAGRPSLQFPAGLGLGAMLVNASVPTAQPLMASLFVAAERGEELARTYELIGEAMDARVAAARAERETAAFRTRQVWLQYLLDDRWAAQEVIDHQGREIERQGQLLDQRERELREERSDFEALRRDRAKAQLIMDAQAVQVRHWIDVGERLTGEVTTLKGQLKAAKELIKFAKNACRKGGKCFQVPSGPKEHRPLHVKIARELQRIPRRLGLTSPPAAPPKKTKAAPAPATSVDRYQAWMARHEPDAAALELQRRAFMEAGPRPKFSLLVSEHDQPPPFPDAKVRPKFSLLLPVHDTPPHFLDEMLESIVAQTYDNWEVCLVDGGSTKRETIERLKAWETREPKLHIVRLATNLGIAENTNRALAVAKGEFIACVDHDDVLAPFALYELAAATARAPHADILYSDEDRLDVNGRRHSPFFKPEWDPELLCSFMYIGHLTAYRRALVVELGGFRQEFDLSQDYDLALRATERAREICHVPHVLYHWREHPASGNMGGKPDARKSNLAALGDAMRRRQLPAEIIEYPTANRARLKLARWPCVSIIVPTDSPGRARACLIDLPAKTRYPNLEIVVVTNSRLLETLRALQPASARVQLVAYDKPFNFSDKCNSGAHAATGERFIFFNDDVEPTQPDWIENVIEQLENPAVGAVAPKLLYENGNIQHAGIVTGVRGFVGTAFHQLDGNITDYFNLAQSLRDVSVLSGACLAMRRDDFFRVGEWDAINTPVAHSDLDLCFKIRAAGLRCVYTPFVTMTHRGHESIGAEKAQAKVPAREKHSVFLLKRWTAYTCHDPYYPDNMRDWLYADSPTPIRMWGRDEPIASKSEADLLFVSHDLSLSGAPLILWEMAKWCKARGFFVVVMSPEDGPMRSRYCDAGIPVVVDPLVMKEHPSFTEFAREFDAVVASTIFGAPVIRAAKRAGIPHLWWVHEGRVAEDYLGADPGMRTALADAEMIIAPDRRSAQVYQPLTDRPVRVLTYGIPDPRGEIKPRAARTEGIEFLLLGTIENRKGQRVFIEAVRHLPDEVRARARFRIVGRAHDQGLTAEVKTAAAQIENLTYEESVPHAEALALIAATDVMVSASLDETGPLILIEALALGTPILSTRVGAVAEHLTEGEAGIFVEPGDAAGLAAAMERLVREPALIDQLAGNARRAYEGHFAFDRFGREFVDLLREVLPQRRADG